MRKAVLSLFGWVVFAAFAATVFSACESEYEKHYDMAKQLNEEGRLEDAVKEYLLAAQANPKKARPWFRAAKLLKKVEQYTTAAKYCEKALEIDPDYLDVYPELVKMLARAGEFDRAIQEGEKALKLKVVKRDLATVEDIKEQMAEAERLRKLQKSGKWAPGQALPPLPELPTTGTVPAGP